MQQKLIAPLLLVGLMLNPAYAGDGINTENDLIKAGAICMVAAPFVVPVVVTKSLLQRKPDEAIATIIYAPLIPVMGVAMIGGGIAVKATKGLPRTSSANHGPSSSNRNSITTSRSSSYIPKEVYQIRRTEPDLIIDDTGLSL